MDEVGRGLMAGLMQLSTSSNPNHRKPRPHLSVKSNRIS